MNTGEIGQIMINIVKGISGSKPVQLTPGQVINVQVKEVMGETALLNYQGQEIVAKLEADIPQGQQLRCLVEGENNGQIVLKVLNTEQDMLTPAALKSIIEKLGLTDDEVNRSIFGQMVKMKMPLTPETAKQLSAFIHSQKISAQDVWIPVFMRNQGMPLTVEMFNVVKGLLTDINFLQEGLGKLLSATSTEALKPEITGELKQLLTNLDQAIRGMQLNGEDRPDIVTSKLAYLFKQLTGGNTLKASVPAGSGQAQPVSMPLHMTSSPASSTNAVPTGKGEPAGVPTGTGQPAGAPTGTGQPAGAPTGTGQPATIPTGTGEPTNVQTGKGQTTGVSGVTSQSTMVSTGAGQDGAEQTLPGQGTTIQTGVMPNTNQPGQAAEPPVTATNRPGLSVPANQGEVVIAESSSTTANPAGNMGLPDAVGDERPEAFNNIIKRLTDLVQKDTTMDSAKKQQFMVRLNSILNGSEDNGGTPIPDLLPLLNSVINGLSRNSSNDNNELLKLAQNVMDKLETIRNFNDKTEPGRENTFIIYSSVRFEDREEPLSLFVNYRYEGKNKKQDFNLCRVEVKLQTPNLGLVRCEIRVNYRNLNLQFICDNQKTCKIVDSVKETLIEKLRLMNYYVTSVASRVDLTEEGPGFGFGEESTLGLFKLNLRI